MSLPHELPGCVQPMGRRVSLAIFQGVFDATRPAVLLQSVHDVSQRVLLRSIHDLTTRARWRRYAVVSATANLAAKHVPHSGASSSALLGATAKPSPRRPDSPGNWQRRGSQWSQRASGCKSRAGCTARRDANHLARFKREARGEV